MHERDRGADALVGQVGVKRDKLLGRQHALVGDRPRRQRRQVKLDAALARLAFGLLAHAVDDPVELKAAQHLPGRVQPLGAEKDLHHPRHRRERGRAEVRRVGPDVPPPGHLSALDQGILFQYAHRALRRVAIGGQEGQSGGVGTRRGQIDSGLFAQERVGDLDHNAGAVAGVGFGAAGAAVVHPAERREPLAHHVVGAPPVHVGDERDPACVVLECGVVETLWLRSGVPHRAS